LSKVEGPEPIRTGWKKDRYVPRPDHTSGKEGHMKTICALVFVASVLYILLILLKFT
jgi:hypothetical protein